MKNIFIKVTSTIVLCVLSLSIIQITHAFQHMDVCNYTDWDKSGDYYDRLCTEDWLPSEDSDLYSSTINTTIDTTNASTNIEEEKNHDLKDVQHVTDYSFPFGESVNDIDKDKEITNLKNQLIQNNLLLEEYRNQNNELLKHQENLLEKNRKLTVLIEQYIIKATTVEKNTINNNTSVTNTQVEDTLEKQSVSEMIRARIERSNLRNSLK